MFTSSTAERGIQVKDGDMVADFLGHGKVRATCLQWVFPINSVSFILQIPEGLSTQRHQEPKSRTQEWAQRRVDSWNSVNRAVGLLGPSPVIWGPPFLCSVPPFSYFSIQQKPEAYSPDELDGGDVSGPGRLGQVEGRRQGLVRLALSCGALQPFSPPWLQNSSRQTYTPRQAAGGLFLESTNSLREGLGTNFQGTKNLLIFWWNPQVPEISTENFQSVLQDLVPDIRTVQGHELSKEVIWERLQCDREGPRQIETQKTQREGSDNAGS